MSLQSVREFFLAHNLDVPIIELEVSTATVALAAEAHGVAPGRIAKTLAFRLSDGRVIILVASGDARIDNSKFKQVFGRGKMLAAEEVVQLTGHPVGGVCPFGLAQPLPIYLDRSLQNFDEVLPAAGAVHSAVRISPAQLAEVTEGSGWMFVAGRLGDKGDRERTPAELTHLRFCRFSGRPRFKFERKDSRPNSRPLCSRCGIAPQDLICPSRM